MPEDVFTQGIPHIHWDEGVAKGHYFRSAFVFSGVWGMGFPVSICLRIKFCYGINHLSVQVVSRAYNQLDLFYDYLAII